MAIRHNLVVGVDERGVGGEPEAIKFATTSVNDTITLETASPKVSVNIDDLQKAFDQVKDFLKTRPAQATQKTVKVSTVEQVLNEDNEFSN